MKTVMLTVQAAFAVILMYSCFCRLVRTDEETHREIRWAILFEFIAASMVLGAPVIPMMIRQVSWTAWTTPWWIWLALLIAATLMQVVTARYWRHGVPHDFQKD